MAFNTLDAEKIQQLYKVEGLFGLVKKHYPQGTEKEQALLMEFVLHGLASYSLISKKVLEARVEFKDLMGSMLNLGVGEGDKDDDEFDEDNFR
jgi:magnesium chelatase subunit I